MLKMPSDPNKFIIIVSNHAVVDAMNFNSGTTAMHCLELIVLCLETLS